MVWCGDGGPRVCADERLVKSTNGWTEVRVEQELAVDDDDDDGGQKEEQGVEKRRGEREKAARENKLQT